MLILTRKPGESIYIGDGIKVVVVEIKGNQIRLGIDAPSDVRIYREEIYLQILEENKKAAEASDVTPGDLEGLSAAFGRGGSGQMATGGDGVPKVKLPSAIRGLSPQVFKKKKGSKGSDE